MTSRDDDLVKRPEGNNADEWHLFLSLYLDNRASFPNGLTFMAVQIAETIDAALDAQAARVKELEALCDRLKLEAQMHSGEARAHKSTVHECYQAASGATGEPGNWHGATPVRDRIATLEAQLEAFREAAVPFADIVEHDIGHEEADQDIFKPMTAHNLVPLLRIGDLRRLNDALMSALRNTETQDG